MKYRSIVILSFCFLFLTSCAETEHRMIQQSFDSQIRIDPLILTYPKYRIGHLIRKVTIIGFGENKETFTAFLTKYFIDYPLSPIKVIESGNLEAILKGRIIEYSTGLTQEESRAISSMLQVDHIIFFNEKITPHQDYIYGGRCSTQISLKIIDTMSGEVIFQTIKEWGINFPDPRPNFSYVSPEPSLRVSNTCMHMIAGELMYAMGEVKIGFLPKEETSNTIGNIMINSPAYKAGIREGDKLIEVSGLNIASFLEYFNSKENRYPKQGDTLLMKIERDGNISEVEVKYPIIPKMPVETLKDEESKPVGPRI